MKRHGQLMAHITAWPNLLAAARRALAGKRHQPDAAAFWFRLEPELLALQADLASGTYSMGPYQTFWITDPKPRCISAACFRDRVAHHAICAIIGPLLDAKQIHDSYACRIGKGTHAALDRTKNTPRPSGLVGPPKAHRGVTHHESQEPLATLDPPCTPACCSFPPSYSPPRPPRRCRGCSTRRCCRRGCGRRLR